MLPVSGQYLVGFCRGSSPAVLAAGPLRAGGEPLHRATPARLSGAPEKELLAIDNRLLRDRGQKARINMSVIFKMKRRSDENPDLSG
jgi:hypothetical protein